MMSRMAAITEGAIMAAALVWFVVVLVFVPPLPDGVPVSVTVAPLDWVTVYVIGFPLTRGPAVAVWAGAVIVAPPCELPPMTDWIRPGTE